MLVKGIGLHPRFLRHDNACAETFFKTLKVECDDRAHFKTHKEAENANAAYRCPTIDAVLTIPLATSLPLTLSVSSPDDLLPTFSTVRCSVTIPL